MAIDRRELILALLAGAAAARPALAESGKRFVSCRTDAGGEASVCVFGLDGQELFSTRIPSRGHDTAARPGYPHIVAFARRPGNWFAAIDAATGSVLASVVSEENRHFYGHGVFSADGKILYATENNVATGDGVVGLYDATLGYRRLGEFPSGGIGPHDIALMPGGGTLLAANGGLKTHPESGRETLDPGGMKPNLAFIDLCDGSVTRRVELEPSLWQLSIRHLAVADDGSAVFGCQHEGDPESQPPLVGILRPDGEPAFLAAPEDVLQRMENYVGSVGFDGSGEFIAATSPRGGQIMIWARATGKLVKATSMADVCGLAALGPGLFAASSGNSGVRPISVGARRGSADAPVMLNWVWDNHLNRAWMPGGEEQPRSAT